jgi:hypothetical protein
VANVQAPIEYSHNYVLISENTLIGYNMPPMGVWQVLGAISGDIDDLKRLVKEQYPVIYDVIQCESSWDNNAKGKAGEIGIAQFMPDTWKLFSEKSGKHGDINNAEDQVDLMIWAFENNLQNHWTCYRNLYKAE